MKQMLIWGAASVALALVAMTPASAASWFKRNDTGVHRVAPRDVPAEVRSHFREKRSEHVGKRGPQREGVGKRGPQREGVGKRGPGRKGPGVARGPGGKGKR